VYRGSWASPSSTAHYFSTLRSSPTGGASAAISGYTAGFTLVGQRCPWCGRFAIYIDGRYIRTVDTYASSARARAPLYTITWPSIGHHLLQLVVVQAGGKRVYLDGIAIVR
jgi:hypothetical protein